MPSIIVNINGKDKIFPLESHVFGEVQNRIDISKHVKEGRNRVIFVYSDAESKIKGKELRVYIEVGRTNGRD